jgi:hypothetical protein
MTRMWDVNPKVMCTNHLLGEHREMHQVKGMVEKYEHAEAVMEGLAGSNAIDTDKIRERHDVLVAEMKERGYDGHKTPMEPVDDKTGGVGKVDTDESMQLLLRRCEDCRERAMNLDIDFNRFISK